MKIAAIIEKIDVGQQFVFKTTWRVWQMGQYTDFTKESDAITYKRFYDIRINR